MTDFEIPTSDLDEWLNELKPYQRNTINKLLTSSSPEEIAKIWISASGSQNTIQFGGERNTEPFWDRFEGAFKKFICDETSYVEEKSALIAEAPVTRALLIAAVSSAIGATIGYAATLLAPAVVLLFYSVGKIGKNAYCAGQ